MRLISWMAVGLVACTGAPPGASVVGTTGASLNVDYFGDTDVVGFHFEVTRVACDAYDAFVPETITGNVDLVDGIFPGMISLVEQTLDPTSRHLGSDFFVTLDPGCYDVMAVPAASVDGDLWTASADCASVSTSGIQVDAGLTTEATLLSQCLGDPTGALDVLVLLNHPPVFDLEIDEKFDYECEPVHVCATIHDVDDDPIEVVWTNESATPLFDLTVHPPTVIGFEGGHRIWEACADITPQTAASYDISIEVYDLGIDAGVPVRLEDLVAPELSHAELQFPIHTNWAEEPLCIDGTGTAVPADGVAIERAEGCYWTSAEEYWCSGNFAVDPDVAAYVCDGMDLIEEALYPACPSAEVCDGIDNDGDGAVDEGFVTGSTYTYSDSPTGNPAAGTFDEVTSVFDELAETWHFRTELGHTNGTSNAFTIAINDGVNPKGHGELALVYADCTGGNAEPQITIYAYNGLNGFSSWSDGSSDAGTQAPDPIANSVSDPGLVLSSSCADSGTSMTIDFVLDVSDINSHTPLYIESYDWKGIIHDTSFGIWFHPWSDAALTYDIDGWITSYSYGTQGWFDASYLPATEEEVCVPE